MVTWSRDCKVLDYERSGENFWWWWVSQLKPWIHIWYIYQIVLWKWWYIIFCKLYIYKVAFKKINDHSNNPILGILLIFLYQLTNKIEYNLINKQEGLWGHISHMKHLKKKALMYVSLFLSCKGSSRGSTILVNSFETIQFLQEEANPCGAKFYTFHSALLLHILVT